MKDGKYEIVSKVIGPNGKSHDGMIIGWFQIAAGKIITATPTLMHMGKPPALGELLRQYSNHAYYDIRKA